LLKKKILEKIQLIKLIKLMAFNNTYNNYNYVFTTYGINYDDNILFMSKLSFIKVVK